MGGVGGGSGPGVGGLIPSLQWGQAGSSVAWAPGWLRGDGGCPSSTEAVPRGPLWGVLWPPGRGGGWRGRRGKPGSQVAPGSCALGFCSFFIATWGHSRAVRSPFCLGGDTAPPPAVVSALLSFRAAYVFNE